MSSTTFTDGQSIIYSSWLNDVNTAVYSGTFPNGSLSLTNLTVSGSVSGAGFTSLVNNSLSAPGAIGNATPNTGAFTTLTATTPIAVSSGGTGSSTLTANNVLLGNGTSALQKVAPGTSGNVLTSNGTTWVSSAPTVIKGLGFGGETWHTVSRSANTVYQNNRTYPIMVNPGALGAGSLIYFYCDSTSTPTQIANTWQFGGSDTIGGIGGVIVPPNFYYSCTVSSGTWYELY